MTVTPPNANGEGGGTVTTTFPDGHTVVDSTGWRPQWDMICAEIDAELDPFNDIPEPWRFNSLIDDLAVAARQLMTPAAIDAINERGGSMGSGPITDYLGYIADVCSDLDGLTIFDFQTKFLGALGRTLTSCYNITLALGAGLAGEQGLWDQTPKSIQDVIDKATSAFGPAVVPWGDLSAVLKVMAAGLSTFAAIVAAGPTMGGSLVAAALASGVSFVTEFGTAWQDVKPGWNDTGYERAMAGFKSDVANLLASISEQESFLQTSLQLVVCDDSLRLWNQLAGPGADGEPRYDDLGDFDGVQWDSDKIRKITDALTDISAVLAKAANEIDQSVHIGPWLRDYRVGLGGSGCFSDWSNVQSALQDLVADLAWQTETAGELLQLASTAFEKQDEASAEALRNYAQQVEGGYVTPPHYHPAQRERVPGHGSF
ncbi:MAG: hypothetical protein FWD63_08315 [Propionibacteriaceae bacterium]|nr:hypothetical protein [Propionibacteriaceae bacterium]